TPELRVNLPEEQHGQFMDALGHAMTFEGASVVTIDGFRVEFPDGWGLIRPSNTSPVLVLRFEADNAEALARIQQEFRSRLLSVNADLKLPF
ncbi:MAG TPA: phosphomannomutase/phosphoglucomutase, partial [Gammaproteobacteria bacterium]